MIQKGLVCHSELLKVEETCTSSAQAFLEGITPLVLCYFDTVVVWLKYPLNKSRIEQLKALCGHTNAKGERVDIVVGTRAMPYRPEFKQRLELHQPTRDALRLLHMWCPNAHISQVHPACDLLFTSRYECRLVHAAIHAFHYKPHSRHDVLIFDQIGERPSVTEATRYTDFRSRSNKLVVYGTRPCRLANNHEPPLHQLSGQHCLHLEMRLLNGQTVQSHGLSSLSALIAFDAGAYWRQHMSGHICCLNLEELGRKYHNSVYRRKRRKPLVIACHRLLYNVDVRIGSTIAHLPMQTAMRVLGRELLRPFLVEVNVLAPLLS